jgi:DNA-binding winged helix-turn-helix (wHTH) protein
VSSPPLANLMIYKVPKGVTISGHAIHEVLPTLDFGKKEFFVLGRPSTKPDEPKPDIEVNDQWVSGKHATIFYDRANNCLMLRDEGSTHGTFLNGERLMKNGQRPLPKEAPAFIGLAEDENGKRIKLKFWVGTLTRSPAELTVDVDNKRACLGYKDIGLTKKEFEVLCVLYNNFGTFCGWEVIRDSIWAVCEESNVRKHIKSIRKKIGDNAPSGKTGLDYIKKGETGRGYKLELDCY